jgi:hypothetical protein
LLIVLSPVEPADVERELDGVNVVRMAHQACYVLWREESVARHAAADRGSGEPKGQPREGG